MAALALGVCMATTAACEQGEAPAGPPRCEPEAELWLERLLKEGYRALTEGYPDEAIARFERALALDPKHPEGLRALAQAKTTPVDDPSETAPPPDGAPSSVQIAGRMWPSPVPVVHGTFDFQTLRLLAPLRRAQTDSGAAPPAHDWFGARAGAGPNGDASADTATTALLSHIDLIVLHDTHTATAAEAFVNFEYSGASTHFLIDADGTIYQTLDLAFEANHTRQKTLDGRSVAVDLVNPVDIDSAPGPEGGPPRPLSDFESLQGRPPVQERGYTQPQMDALVALVGALCEFLPATPCTLPALDGAGRIPRGTITGAETFRGIAGHLHLTPIATDPGAGFSWEDLARSLPLKR